MQQTDLPTETLKAFPGLVGAIIALRWVPGTPMQRLAAVVGGAAAGYYGSPLLQRWAGIDHGLAGFLIGLFGMAMASRMFEALTVINLPKIIERILAKFGL